MWCVECKELVDPNAVGTYREIEGWEKVRAGGGANQVVARVETGRLMHAHCGEALKVRIRLGLGDRQEALL